MSTGRLASAHRLLAEALDGLCAVAHSGAADEELLSVLTLGEGVNRRLDRVTVGTIATLARCGASPNAAISPPPLRCLICSGGSVSRLAVG